MASLSPRRLAVIDQSRQSEELCADAQLALYCRIQVHYEAHVVLLHYELHDAAGCGEPIDIADGEHAGILKASQDLRGALALGCADEKNVTAAQVVATTILSDCN